MEHAGSRYITVDVNGQSVPLISAEDHIADAGANDRGGYDPARRLEAIEADGVWGEILYPTVGLYAWSMPEPEISVASARVYNDWMAETFKGYGDRLCAGAMIPAVAGAEAAVSEIDHAAKLGLKPLMLPIIAPHDRPYSDPSWNPVWAAAEERGLPVSFHAASGIDATGIQGYDPGEASEHEGLMHQERLLLVMVQMVAGPAHALLAQLLVGNVFDRYPRLNFAIVETQTGWLAWVLDELDNAAGFGGEDGLGLKQKPSDYVRRQVGVTFMDDRVGLNNRTITGTTPLLWGSDYPHPEGTWPHSSEALDRLFQGVSPEERAAITGGNAARIFGFEV
jgi:predicted TIM-barrel fold metal-dependent hydrolase